MRAPVRRDSDGSTRVGGAVVTAVVVAAVVVLLGLAVAGVGFALTYPGHDRPELVGDDELVDATVSQACADLAERLDGIPEAAGDDGIADVVVREDQAVTDMVAAVRALGQDRLDQDRPMSDWLADWEDLVRLREAAAAATRTQGAPFSWQLPTVDGRPVTDRMNDAVWEERQVPGRLLTGSRP